MIPKIIHQSWKTTDLSTYGNSAKKSQESWKKIYPDFEYKFWTDNDIVDYMKNQPHVYQRAFDDLDQNIKKMDFFRYLILHEYGGIYSDMDFIANQRIKKHIISKYSFIGYKAPRPQTRVLANNDDDGTWVVGNAFFGCEPGEIVMELAINEIIMTCKHTIHPVHHTGPDMVNRIIKENNLLSHEKVFIFKKDDISNSDGRVGYHVRCHQWD